MDTTPSDPHRAESVPAAPAAVSTTDAASPPPAMTAAEAALLQLSEQQQTAIVALTSGHSRGRAASAAGVSRMTLHRWLTTDAVFAAAYNSWQHDVIVTAQARLLAGANDAVSTVLNAVREGDAKLAWKLLQSIAATPHPAPGPTDPLDVQREQRLDQERKQVAQRKARAQVDLDDAFTPGRF